MSRPALDSSSQLVLGLAATAMPFAGSVDEQAERWLRLLRSHGTAGLLLASLGVTEQPIESQPTSKPAPDVQSAATARRVTDTALREAARRGARTVETTDVLAAVLSVYDDVFDRALERHGCESWQLRSLLELEQSPGEV